MTKITTYHTAEEAAARDAQLSREDETADWILRQCALERAAIEARGGSWPAGFTQQRGDDPGEPRGAGAPPRRFAHEAGTGRDPQGRRRTLFRRFRIDPETGEEVIR